MRVVVSAELGGRIVGHFSVTVTRWFFRMRRRTWEETYEKNQAIIRRSYLDADTSQRLFHIFQLERLLMIASIFHRSPPKCGGAF